MRSLENDEYEELLQFKPCIGIYSDTPSIDEYWASNNTVRVVVSDVRFPNEYNIIKKLGGIIINVDRKDYNLTDTHELCIKWI